MKKIVIHVLAPVFNTKVKVIGVEMFLFANEIISQ